MLTGTVWAFVFVSLLFPVGIVEINKKYVLLCVEAIDKESEDAGK